MDIVVFVAGIADPKKPLNRPAHLDELRAARSTQPALGPFDEAALEIALKLRDADESSRITAWVAAESAADPLLRNVASLRIDDVRCLATAIVDIWNAHALAAALADVIDFDRRPDVVLMGREFGDFDDGSVPALFAERLGWTYRSLATSIVAGSDGLEVVRQRAGRLWRSSCSAPLVASVTNDAGNRLRHPLLKNVMAARKRSFEGFAPEVADAAPIRLLHAGATVSARRGEPCRMLTGDASSAAGELARVLTADRA